MFANMPSFQNLLPLVVPAARKNSWFRRYNAETFQGDIMATLVVVVMLIPQSLGYAMVAGLPPQVGLYASILPALVYALLGSSMTLSVGPAAVPALMTLAALSAVATPGTPEYLQAAGVLTVMCGAVMLALGAMRFGFLTHFLSHGVISAFTTASALIIAASQLRHVLGVPVEGITLPEIGLSLLRHIGQLHVPTLVLAGISLGLLVGLRAYAKPLAQTLGANAKQADMAQRASPMLVVVGATLATWGLGLHGLGIRVVGEIPQGLPGLMLPSLSPTLWGGLATSAMLIGLLIYVESISIAQAFAARRRQKVVPDRELWAVGAANVASSITGGCPVAGSFSRSAVNFQAGAQTPLAGVFTALGIALMALLATGLLTYLPLATLAATIIVAVLPVANFRIFEKTWRYSRRDGASLLATFFICLLLGVEAGVAAGVFLSLAFFLQQTSNPDIVVLGRLAGSTNFRDARHHDVEFEPGLLLMRVDMSLYFANAAHIESLIEAEIERQKPNGLRHVVLVGSGINMIDANAEHMLEDLADNLHAQNIGLHFAAMKSAVMKRLERSGFFEHLAPGQVFVSAHEAAEALRD